LFKKKVWVEKNQSLFKANYGSKKINHRSKKNEILVPKIYLPQPQQRFPTVVVVFPHGHVQPNGFGKIRHGSAVFALVLVHQPTAFVHQTIVRDVRQN
jgi:hypothetical protein